MKCRNYLFQRLGGGGMLHSVQQFSIMDDLRRRMLHFVQDCK